MKVASGKPPSVAVPVVLHGFQRPTQTRRPIFSGKRLLPSWWPGSMATTRPASGRTSAPAGDVGPDGPSARVASSSDADDRPPEGAHRPTLPDRADIGCGTRRGLSPLTFVSDGLSLRERVARLRVDVTPLRTSRDFRRLFAAGTVFYLGAMVSYVALPYQIYQLTGSNFAVGAMALVELVPLVVFGLYGGALADHVDRRKMLVLCGLAQVVLTGALLANALLDRPSVWAIYVVGFLLTIAQSLQRPSREALLPRVVRHDQLAAAAAVQSLGMQIGTLLGPALGGVLVATAGVSWAYAVDIVGLVLATALFASMRRYPPTEHSTPPSVESIVSGIRYAVGRRDLLGTYVIDMVAMFMAMPIVLFPAFAEKVLERPHLLGLLYTAESVGTLLATLVERMDDALPPPRPGGRRGLDGLGRVDGPGRPLADDLARAVLPRLRRGGGHDQRHLPQHDLEPDHPRRAARSAGRHRDAVLLASARWAARPGPGWWPT